MLKFGLALKCNREPYHRCIILSDAPVKEDDPVVLVRVTSDIIRKGDYCILTPEDWHELDRRSVVAFSTANVGPGKVGLEGGIKLGDFEIIDSPSPDVLRRIVKMGLEYSDTKPAVKAAISRTLL